MSQKEQTFLCDKIDQKSCPGSKLGTVVGHDLRWTLVKLAFIFYGYFIMLINSESFRTERTFYFKLGSSLMIHTNIKFYLVGTVVFRGLLVFLMLSIIDILGKVI